MTTTASAFDHATPHRSPAPLRTPGSRLGPTEDFPEEQTGLGMTELQVVHSRVIRQLDRGYLTDPTGPYSATTDRCQDLHAELDARDTA